MMIRTNRYYKNLDLHHFITARHHTSFKVKGEFFQNSGHIPEFYSTKFEHYARSAIHHGVREVWYPSTVAISERPSDMVEYTLAKAMGESTLKTLINEFPDIKFSAPRLPRTTTDQTASLLSVSSEPAIKIVLKNVL